MANHASAEKRNRQRINRTIRNKAFRSALRTLLKRARTALDSGVLEEAAPHVARASKVLARAAAKGLIHKNTASRTTSRINKHLSAVSKAQAAG